jgi:hypothetical protein
MRTHATVVLVLGLLGLSLAAAAAGEGAAAGREQPSGQGLQAGDYRITGPYTQGNLTIFLIHGKDAHSANQYLTLAEALEQKKAVVNETQTVNEVTVENLTPEADIYIEAGDIIKGGQQDRVIGTDIIITAKSGKVAIPCFCVEASRWQKRGSEAADKFEASPGKAAGKEIQVAAQYSKDQHMVWKKVAECQMKLGQTLNKSVQATASPTSLQLSQEDKDLLATVESYAKELGKAPEGKKDVIGCAVAINGKVEGADVYGSAAMFAKLWPRLLGANAIEAVADLKKGQKFEPATAEAVAALLADADKAKTKEEKDLGRRGHVTTRESDKNLLFELRDQAQQAMPAVHKSYKAK